MWDPFDTGGYFSIAKLIGFIYLAIMIPAIMEFKTPKIYKEVLWPVLFFFGFLTVINIFNIRTGYSEFFDFSIFQNIILLWILINHEIIDNLVLEKSLISFALGTIVLSILFSAGIGIEHDPLTYRTTIFGDNANSVGIHMSISLIILFVALIQNRLSLKLLRFVLMAGIPFIFYAMISTGSRVSFIAFIMALFTFFALFKTKNKWGKPVFILFATFVTIYTWHFFLKSEGITQRLILSIQEGDLSNRDIIWKSIFPIWLENPFFGIGQTGYDYVVFAANNRLVSPHNVVLEILCLTGITGFFFYFLFLFRISKVSFMLYRKYNYLLSILLLIPVTGLLMSAQLLQVKIGWIIYAYILANSIYLNPKKLKNQQNENTLCNR
jgi:O-antigen ligase